MSTRFKRRVLISLIFVLTVIGPPAVLFGQGTTLYFLAKFVRISGGSLIRTSATMIYASPSNYDETFYEYPFTMDSINDIERNTDGYLVPLLRYDDKYLLQDCPSYHDGEGCPGNLLTYYQNITVNLIPSTVDVYTHLFPMTPKYNNQKIYSCSTEQLKNGKKFVAFIVCFVGLIFVVFDGITAYVAIIDFLPSVIRRIRQRYPENDQMILLETDSVV